MICFYLDWCEVQVPGEKINCFRLIKINKALRNALKFFNHWNISCWQACVTKYALIKSKFLITINKIDLETEMINLS